MQSLRLTWIFPFVFGLPLLSRGDLGSAGHGGSPSATPVLLPQPVAAEVALRTPASAENSAAQSARCGARPHASQQMSCLVMGQAANCSHTRSGASAPFGRVCALNSAAGTPQCSHQAALAATSILGFAVGHPLLVPQPSCSQHAPGAGAQCGAVGGNGPAGKVYFPAEIPSWGFFSAV